MNNLPQLQETDSDVIAKMNAWANLGKSVTLLIPQLQARSQKLILANPLPNNKEQIATYESALKDARKQLTEDIDLRKATSAKFDTVIAKLMEPEKATTAHFVQYADALLKLKQAVAEDERKKQAAIDEANNIRLAFTYRIAQLDTNYKSMIAVKVAEIYERALGGECLQEDNREFLSKEREAFAPDYTFHKPNLQRMPVYTDAEQVQAIWDSLEKPDPAIYPALFWNDLTTKFEFYPIALKHREASIAQANKERDEKLVAARKDQEAQETIAKMENAATTTAQIASAGKGVKQFWAVEMPFSTPAEGRDSALKIMIAFCANLALCEGGKRASWETLNVSQMAGCLAWAKNQDEKFEATGIVFLKKDKL